MVYVNDTACNGCGACVETCPTGALILQNSHAFIDQNLCQGCEICLDICPQGAIISGEMVPEAPTVIRMPEVHVQMASDEHLSLREMVLPVFGSFLLWMGRNLVPRLADAALGYLDQRVQSPPSRASQTWIAR
jgi:NAD-dependent dihydropyrimidine dehydrogenase PreA subunit